MCVCVFLYTEVLRSIKSPFQYFLLGKSESALRLNTRIYTKSKYIIHTAKPRILDPWRHVCVRLDHFVVYIDSPVQSVRSAWFSQV